MQLTAAVCSVIMLIVNDVFVRFTILTTLTVEYPIFRIYIILLLIKYEAEILS